MALRIYSITFLISLVCFALYWMQWRKNYSVLYTLTFSIITIANIGYVMSALSVNLEEALMAHKLIYLGGCFLLMLMTFYIFEMCHVVLPYAAKCLLVVISVIFYLSALTMGKLPYFYRSVYAEIVDGKLHMIKEYAPMHTAFQVYTIILFLISYLVLSYALRHRPQASRKNIRLLFITQSVSVFSFFFGRMFMPDFEWLSIAYVFDEFIYLIIARRTTLYDVESTVSKSIAEQGNYGFALFDKEYNYLGCNGAAYSIIPALKTEQVDFPLKEKDELTQRIRLWLEAYHNDPSDSGHIKDIGEQYYRFDISDLKEDEKMIGYQLMVTNVTQQQKYMELINNFNGRLQEDVKTKTEHIQNLQDSFILGMATMVESRDNSTGGHIRRTSDVVRILMKEIMKDNIFGVDEEFASNVIKAAPMHDLGKIAVDDAILRKPGRFTEEEFEQMKVHAAEGARVVRSVLADFDDTRFKTIAENVAHYHHERWDGSGYPEGIKGENIPLEARIMAVADVYDALVSKRCYKESMSFLEAKGIIINGMGTHFDPRLEPYFMNAVSRMEKYYTLDTTEAEKDSTHETERNYGNKNTDDDRH